LKERQFIVLKEDINEIVGDVSPMLLQDGFRIVDFNFANINRSSLMVLRFVIDKKKKADVRDGITHGDCIRVTKLIEEEMSKRLKIEELDYTIEVSSPGLGRAFSTVEDYEANIGLEIEVRLLSKIGNYNKYSGILKEINASSEASAIIIELTEAGDKKIQDLKKKKKKKDDDDVQIPSLITIPLSQISKTTLKIHF